MEPYRKYFFICEGSNTEVCYFQELIDLRKKIGIHSLIDIRLVERTDKDIPNSHPKKLFEYADNFKKNKKSNFDKKHDKIIIVFDADIFESRSDTYTKLLQEAEKFNFLLGVTNPCFEIFLLLHFEDAYETNIKPFLNEFLKKDNLKKHGLAYTLLSQKTSINSKSNKEIGKLAKNVKTAIEEEKYLNQDLQKCKGNVTSNIGKIIDTIISDDGS